MKITDQIKERFKQKNGIVYIDETVSQFENIYLNVRSAEGRLYNDSQVKDLPEISRSHKHFNEWKQRKESSQLLLDYIGAITKVKKILDLGCGNGWLSNKLAEISDSEVIGIDVNKTELEQAARVFADKRNIAFVLGNITNLNYKFDFITLAGVAAYFNDLKELLLLLLEKLNRTGEIHILDSPFYSNIEKAKQNSMKHYNDLGFGEMINYYHPHTLDELNSFIYEILYDPNTIVNRFKRKMGINHIPFYWIKITA